jgi:hypothetical protein
MLDFPPAPSPPPGARGACPLDDGRPARAEAKPGVAARLAAARARALADCSLPAAVLLSDRRASLARLALAGAAEESVGTCLARWREGRIAELLHPHPQADAADPDLARITEEAGQLRILWTADPALAPDVVLEALALGAIPACPDAPGLDRFAPGAARIDLTGLDATAALARVRSVRPDARQALAWLAARQDLARRLADPDRLAQERRLVVREMLRALPG